MCIRDRVVELLLAASRSRVIAALVRTRGGDVVRFEADHFLLAAGTVETVRLLLASRSVAPDGVGNGSGQVGHNFHDHLSLPAATITGTARTRMLQMCIRDSSEKASKREEVRAKRREELQKQLEEANAGAEGDKPAE